MLHLPKLLDNGCVLQSSMPITIWGWATSGEIVSVSVQGAVRLKCRSRGRFVVRQP